MKISPTKSPTTGEAGEGLTDMPSGQDQIAGMERGYAGQGRYR